MIAAAVLLGFALGVATVGARLLSTATWPVRSPAWGVWAWQTLTVATAASLVLTGVAVAMPETPLDHVVAALLRACSDALAEHYATPGGVPVATLAGAISAAIVARFSVLLFRDSRAASRHRRAQRDALTLVGVNQDDGYTLIEHRAPLVYCLPGRVSTLVVTSAARQALTSRQLDLVLEHERGHLRAHHHAALTLSGALSATFFGLGVFGKAHAHIAALIEMQADDAVLRTGDRRDLARALLSLTPQSPAHGVIAASSKKGQAAQRVRRLTERAERPGRRVALLAAGAGVLVMGAPLALALGPAFEAAARDCCPTAFDHFDKSPLDSGPGLRQNVIQERP